MRGDQINPVLALVVRFWNDFSARIPIETGRCRELLLSYYLADGCHFGGICQPGWQRLWMAHKNALRHSCGGLAGAVREQRWQISEAGQLPTGGRRTDGPWKMGVLERTFMGKRVHAATRDRSHRQGQGFLTWSKPRGNRPSGKTRPIPFRFLGWMGLEVPRTQGVMALWEFGKNYPQQTVGGSQGSQYAGVSNHGVPNISKWSRGVFRGRLGQGGPQGR